jgi:isocitrate dehydrogenase
MRCTLSRMALNDLTPPAGDRITVSDGKLEVPDKPVVPFIRGDGIGPDIWAASARVFDAAVEKAYGGHRRLAWFEVFAGEQAFKRFHTWLPEDTIEVFKEYRVGIKGPLTTPIASGIRSLNVALRSLLDLYACVRPVRWFEGAPSPVKNPERVDVVLFRENTEDIYAGIDLQAGGEAALKMLGFLRETLPEEFRKIRFGDSPEMVGLGIKPVSKPGAERLVRAAIDYAIAHRRKSVTLVHKGNIMKYTEGAFRDWSYALAKREFGAIDYGGGPWCTVPEGRPGAGLIIKDAIADITLQQVLTRPGEFDVIATLNLNGDYLSDALAAQVGGIGISPGGNINYMTGHAIFEATHGTAPRYANKDMVNPAAVVLSGEMMLRYLGWYEAADCILKGVRGAVASRKVTYDFARMMDGATEIKCSAFGDNVISHM